MSLLDAGLWYFENICFYLVQMVPCAVFAGILFFCLRPVCRRYLSATGVSSPPLREVGLLCFALFAAGLAALTMFPAYFWSSLYRHLWSGEPWEFYLQTGTGFYWKITIGEELLHGGLWTYFMLWGNIIMFSPFGFFAALLWGKPRWWKSMLTAFAASVLVEVTQLFVGRSSDINDIILNTLGGAVGHLMFLLLRRLAPKFTRKFQCTRTEGLYGRKT